MIKLNKKVKIAVVYFDELKKTEKVFWDDKNDDFSDYHKYFYGDADEHKPLAIGDIIGGMNGDKDYNGKVIDIYEMTAKEFVENRQEYVMAGNISPAGYIPCYWVILGVNCDEYEFEVNNGRSYYMSSRYEFYTDENGNRIDYVHIGVATDEDFENDGFNYVDRRESVDFRVCDTLREAIECSGKIADKIEFNLPDEDMEEAKKIVDELMNDAEYLKKFGLRLEGLVVSVYNQKTKEVIKCIMNDEKDENRIRLGDIVEFKTSRREETIASGVVVDMEQNKLNREVCYWYLFKNETGNGFHIVTNEKAKKVEETETKIEVEALEEVPFN